MPKLISVLIAAATTIVLQLIFIFLPLVVGSYIGGAAVSQAQADAAVYHVAIGAGVICAFQFIFIYPVIYQSAIDNFKE